MKRLTFVLVLAIGAVAVLVAPALASAKTFYVAPSGGNDTHNIQAAFNAAVKAGPGSTVQLSAGRFYTNNVLVKNFDGYFKGAGQGRTIIDCLRGLDPSNAPVTLMPKLEPYPFLFAVSGGDVRVSDMTCDITAASPAVSYFLEGATYTALGPVFLVTGNASSSFDRVTFIAATNGDDSGFNCNDGIAIEGKPHLTAGGSCDYMGPTAGTHTVADCSFTGYGGMEVFGLVHGSLMVADSSFTIPVDLTNFSYIGLAGLAFCDNSDAAIEASHNTFNSGNEGIFFWQGQCAANGGALPALPAPRYLVADNLFLGNTYTEGVWVQRSNFRVRWLFKGGSDSSMHARRTSRAGNRISGLSR